MISSYPVYSSLFVEGGSEIDLLSRKAALMLSGGLGLRATFDDIGVLLFTLGMLSHLGYPIRSHTEAEEVAMHV